MTAFLLAVVCWGAGALGAGLARGRAAPALLGAAGAVAGGVAGTVAGLEALMGAGGASWTTGWAVPGGAIALRLDPLAGAFLIPIAVIGGLGAVYGVAYQRWHGTDGALRGSFAAYNLLVLGMAAVVAAANLVLLLVAWETMTLASWALVVERHGDRDARTAGLQYLIAGHVATAALVLMALMLSASTGGFLVAPLARPAVVSTSVLFLLALIGFGTKAGIVPAHVWLPDAHAAAPSHVSALMSGVMITVGFYGLARFLPLFGPPSAWWAYVLLLLGAAGAVGGIALSLAQRDVKRALAYSTVENAGLVTLAMGTGLLGSVEHAPWLAALGWTAALLHLWNHALAKSLLFLGFGAAAQRAHSRDLDAMGGLLRRWRVVGSAAVVGAAGIAALPGLNVFVSEWLLLRGLLAGIVGLGGVARVALLAGLAALAFAGGMAVAAFTRLVGVGLLGVPRTPGAARAAEPGWTMRGPIVATAVGCVAIAAAPRPVVAALAPVLGFVAHGADPAAPGVAVAPLAVLFPALALLTAVVVAVRAGWLRRSPRQGGDTWGCGYSAPSASMQYSSTSYAAGVTGLLGPMLRADVRRLGVMPAGMWPVAGAWESSTRDPALRSVFRPAFDLVGRGAARIRAMHRPRVTTSLVYMVAAMGVLLTLLFLPEFGK